MNGHIYERAAREWYVWDIHKSNYTGVLFTNSGIEVRGSFSLDIAVEHMNGFAPIEIAESEGQE